MTAIGVLGASGFIGSACVKQARTQGHSVLEIRAPRILADPKIPYHELLLSGATRDEVHRIAEEIAGLDVVVNAAGLATAVQTTRMDELFGANGLLPRLVAEASIIAGVRRLVHISSAAVQGTMALDESETMAPFSPYSRSKARGEAELQMIGDRLEIARFRPTSVQGTDREVTRSLARLARSRASTVSGDGSDHTPQVLIENVSSAIIYCATTDQRVSRVILQPSEQLTCRTMLEALGHGRQPRSVPTPVARALVQAIDRVDRLRPYSRRLELLWFGQNQTSGWLQAQGWAAPVGYEGWLRLGEELWRRSATRVTR